MFPKAEDWRMVMSELRDGSRRKSNIEIEAPNIPWLLRPSLCNGIGHAYTFNSESMVVNMYAHVCAGFQKGTP